LEQLPGSDAIFLAMDTDTVYAHVGVLTVLDPSEAPNFSFARIRELCADTKAVSYDAALAGFDHGLVPVQDVLTAQAAWSQAIALQADSDSAIAATLAGLAFGSGKIEAAILRGQSQRP